MDGRSLRAHRSLLVDADRYQMCDKVIKMRSIRYTLFNSAMNAGEFLDS